MKNEMKQFMKNDYVIILDTNIYLNLYEYAPHVSDVFLDILEEVFDSIYLPYAVSKEFDKNHRVCHGRQRKKFSNIPNILSKYTTQMKDKISKQFEILSNFKFPNIDSLQEDVKSKLQEIEDIFEEYVTEHNVFDEINNSFLEADRIQELVQRLITDGHLLEGFTRDELYDICEEGERRYKKKTPPGFMDQKDKTGIQLYNDLIIWKEVLKFSKANDKYVIFVTDDVKPDWYDNINQKAVFHPMLVEEFEKVTSHKILAMTSAELFNNLSTILGKEMPSNIECILNYDNENYIDTIVDSELPEDVLSKISFSGEEYVDTDTLERYDGSDFEMEDESIEYLSYEFEGIDEGRAYYTISFEVKATGYSREYCGRDDDTKEIILSDRRIHELRGEFRVLITRDIDSYYNDFLDDYSYEDMEIEGLLEEVNSYTDDEICVECGTEIGCYAHKNGGTVCSNCAVGNSEGEICPCCGEKVPFEQMAGNGFCIDCTRENDDL